jgi:hypothetical protein
VTFDLWPHQHQGMRRTYAAINAGARRPLVVMPCGAGKTRTVFEIGMHAVARGRRFIFAAPRRPLVEQCAGKFVDYSSGYVRPSLFMPPHAHAVNARVIVASIQSLLEREFLLGNGDVVAVDEAHLAHALPLMAAQPGVLFIGLTATPLDAGGRHLGDTWDAMVIGAQPSELLGRFIVEPDVYTHQQDGEIVEGAGPAWLRIAGEMRLRTLAFCTSVEHARAVTADYVSHGVRAVMHTDATKTAKRVADFALLRARELDVVVNVGLYREGTDAPWLECAHDMAPRDSLATYLQSDSRVGRACDEKRACVLIDAAGNWMKPGYGPVFADRPWSLTTSQRDLEMIDAPVLRQCARCGSRFPVTCPRCGDVGTAMPRAVAAHAAGSLRRMTPEEREAMLREAEALTREMERVRRTLRGIASDVVGGRNRGAWSHRAKTWEDEFRTVAGGTAASVRAAWPAWLAGLRRRVA